MPLTAGGQITNEVDAGSGKKTAAPERGFLPGQVSSSLLPDFSSLPSLPHWEVG